MIALTPSLLIAAATALVGTHEEGGENRGQLVELFLREVHLPPGYPWCAAFVYHVGRCSHWDHRVRQTSWPLPATASCAELGAFARNAGVLSTEPTEGCVFLKADASGEFHHTGIVVSVERREVTPSGDTIWMCTTIEGNTNDDGSREGCATLVKERTLSTQRGDRFIHWARLDRRAANAA